MMPNFKRLSPETLKTLLLSNPYRSVVCRVFIALALWLSGFGLGIRPARAQVSLPKPHYAGWAIIAYPGETQATMEAALRRMKEAGANVAWIGHNNPGEVDATKAEPGLSYAVYAAAQDPAHPLYTDALLMIEAEHRMLRAARAVGLPVVFPIGYQGQMGSDWNVAHPDELRRYPTGEPLDIYGGGVSASPYSALYRADIRGYYNWVLSEFVRPYRDVILMLNLADEPQGGDYSPLAEAQFRARYHAGFAEAMPEQVGAFQDRVIVDYAVWSARQWAELAPDMPITMSFCGAQGRWSYRMPNIEALFREMPANFVVTFDAYLHDDLPFNPLTDAEVGALVLFARTVGYYSAKYQRDVWLWPAGNRWGLAGDGPNPGGVSDALANGYLLIAAMQSTGGIVRGLAVWNYNVIHQGLFGDPDPAPYNRETLFTQVSAAFRIWRVLMADQVSLAQPQVLALFSAKYAHQQLGLTQAVVRGLPLDVTRLLPLARADISLALVETLPRLPPAQQQTVVVLNAKVSELSPSDCAELKRFVRQGGRVAATSAVIDALWPDLDMTPMRRGQGVVVSLPNDPFALTESDWARVLPKALVTAQGVRVSASNWAVFYQPGVRATKLPFPFRWRVFDPQGALRLNPTDLQPHEFALTP